MRVSPGKPPVSSRHPGQGQPPPPPTGKGGLVFPDTDWLARWYRHSSFMTMDSTATATTRTQVN
jgi:hypothetical protein